MAINIPLAAVKELGAGVDGGPRLEMRLWGEGHEW